MSAVSPAPYGPRYPMNDKYNNGVAPTIPKRIDLSSVFALYPIYNGPIAANTIKMSCCCWYAISGKNAYAAAPKINALKSISGRLLFLFFFSLGFLAFSASTIESPKTKFNRFHLNLFLFLI